MAEKNILTEQRMIDIIWGATLMGGGGGGSISSGMDLLNAYKRDHPGTELAVDLIKPGDMAEGTYAAATAGMGAPAAIVGVDCNTVTTGRRKRCNGGKNAPAAESTIANAVESANAASTRPRVLAATSQLLPSPRSSPKLRKISPREGKSSGISSAAATIAQTAITAASAATG